MIKSYIISLSFLFNLIFIFYGEFFHYYDIGTLLLDDLCLYAGGDIVVSDRNIS